MQTPQQTLDERVRLFNIKTASEKLIDKYAGCRGEIEASTWPVESIAAIGGFIVDARPVAAPTMAHLVFPRRSALSFFSYKIGDTIPTGFATPATREATPFHTTLTNPRSVPGGRSMAIESISLTVAAKRIQWSASLFPDGEAPTNQVVLNAYAGGVPVGDPAGLMSPVQFDSPANLQEVLSEIILPCTTWTIIFNQNKVRKIGYLDQIPEGSGKSYLKAHGEPAPDVRFRVPEGYFWTGEGDASDRELEIEALLESDVVIPISLPVGLVGSTPSTRPVPTAVALDLRMRLHGPQIGIPNRN